jgi:prepilin-type N-terminal cleavage/methylation domain-containing protein
VKHRILSGRQKAFTIVELVVVISVIAILALVVVVSYGAWQSSIRASQVKNDLTQAAAAMQSSASFGTTGYPSAIPPSSFQATSGVNIGLTNRSATTFCIDASSSADSSIKYYIDESHVKDNKPQAGTCGTRTATTAPGAPTNLTLGSVGATSVALSWTAPTGVVSSYQMQCAEDGGFLQNPQTATATATNGTVSGTKATTNQFCHVRAQNNIGYGPWSSIVTYNSSDYQPPTGLTSSAIANTTLTLTWTPTPNVDGYNLQCTTDPSFNTGVQNASTTGGSVTFSGLTPYTTYNCRINLYAGSKTSAWSSSVPFKTTANFGTIPPATNLQAASLAATSGNFTWTGITCNLGTPEYSFVWVSPQTGSTAWSSATAANGITYSQLSTNTWKVQSHCIYNGQTSSVTDSSPSTFTATAISDPGGSFGTFGWNDRFVYDVNGNSITCTSPATKQFQLVQTLVDYTWGTWVTGWSTATAFNVPTANQGSRMQVYMQARCTYNGTNSNAISSGTRTDAASVDAPWYVPSWCGGTCGSPKGDRWGAVGCPAGTYAVYWTYAVGDYSNPIWGPYEAANFYGYDRGGYGYGNTMVNDYLMARCTSDFRSSGYGPQGYQRY